MLAFPLWAAAAKHIPMLRLLIYTQFAAGVLSILCYESDSLPDFWFVSLLMQVFKGSYLLIYPFVMSLEHKDRHGGTIGLLSVIVHLGAIAGAGIAARHLVCLGFVEDVYLTQQSIRTFFNTSHPHKRYVKTALSILNMGFMRGLSPYYMSTTPAINDCINGLIEQDPYLAEKGFSILREVAAVGYRNHYYETATTKDSPYKKMLSALWRESPMPQLKPGQRLMTMAALLHTDAQGTALLPELIKSSGIDTTSWLRHYLNCYLSPPLLHCFYAYDLVFMPHGENLILVLENNVPVRAIMKDIAEEAAIMNK